MFLLILNWFDKANVRENVMSGEAQ